MISFGFGELVIITMIAILLITGSFRIQQWQAFRQHGDRRRWFLATQRLHHLDLLNARPLRQRRFLFVLLTLGFAAVGFTLWFMFARP